MESIYMYKGPKYLVFITTYTASSLSWTVLLSLTWTLDGTVVNLIW